jgi:uncharacterized protein
MSRSNLSYLKNVFLAAVGIPCGVLTGLTGLSCAPILLPLLTWLIGANGAPLGGIVLATISFTAWSGLLAFGQLGHVSWFDGFMLLLGTFLGAFIAARSILYAPKFFVRARKVWSIIPLLFALLMVVQSLGIVPKSALHSFVLPHAEGILVLLWSLVIGAFVGFIGQVGELGSLLIIPMLLYILGWTILQAEGTALFVLVLASLPAAVVHALRGSMNTRAALSISIGAACGALYGSHNAVYHVQTDALMLLCGGTLAVFSLLALFQRLPVTLSEGAEPLAEESTD